MISRNAKFRKMSCWGKDTGYLESALFYHFILVNETVV